MTSETERNKATIRRLLAAADAGDIDAVAACFTDDYRDHAQSGSRVGDDKAAALAAFTEFRSAFPDTRHVIHTMIAEGDRIAVRLSATATHSELVRGIPATGYVVTLTSTALYRMVDGRIAERWVDGAESVVDTVKRAAVAHGGTRVLRSTDTRWRPHASGGHWWEVRLHGVSLTGFRLPPNASFLAHTHASEQITVVIEGNLIFDVEGARHVLSAGDVIAIPGGVEHAVTAGEHPVVALDAWSPPPEHLGTEGDLPTTVTASSGGKRPTWIQRLVRWWTTPFRPNDHPLAYDFRIWVGPRIPRNLQRTDEVDPDST